MARLCLPNETIEQILEYAWTSTTSATERKVFFATLATADAVLHTLLSRIATHCVIIDVSRFSTDDMDLYADRSYRAAEAVVGNKRSSLRIDQYYNLELPEDDLLAFRRDLYKSSHLRIEGFTGASDQARHHRDISSRETDDTHRRTWGYVLAKLTHIIPDAFSVTVAPAPGSSWPVVKQIVPALLFPTLRSFPSLRSVHFATFFEVLNYANHSAAPPYLPRVTSLRLAHVPICECPSTDWRPRRADGHLACCLAATLLESFPNLRHLHIESPVFLKTLRPPASVETLTLDAPPVMRIQGRQAFSSLIEYNVSAAVRRGFMSLSPSPSGSESESESVQPDVTDERRNGKRRKIVVRTGAEEPFGWVSAKAACDEAGIELVKVVEYVEPVVRTDPMLIAIKSADGVSVSVPKRPTVLEAAQMMAAEVQR
ncbi:hypothetical protein L226DRAFT_539846 [Lentinus tigrinus ALCF2SS1-7]|uniref:Uncharacterized protein n=1 Tax=Lentinus tigrinus ALCF2SS1-6 TaxID=1328759 RepID=A0A5C2RS45_9APHY|nr:hypothetical protein L227DRAFT_580452 [Lentinus tigrinus ALCF2SS1-6]RPD69321.1 hypothetical protein L226DRAFT_539846 [Lentinus tigrinus ALCF2SS1-7]